MSIEDRLRELGELLRTAGAEVVGTLVQHCDRPLPRTYLGTGKLADPTDLEFDEAHLEDPDALAAQLADDVRAGLTATPRTIPPKYFYDARGSALFEEITVLPEYFPTRTEAALLTARPGRA